MSKNKKVAVCSAQSLFVRGGADIMANGLYENLQKKGLQVELVQIPFKWDVGVQNISDMITWRLVDFTDFDLVIPLKFPSYMLNHRNKVIWLMHQHRAIYDLYGTPYSGYSENNEFHSKIREQIINADCSSISEAKQVYSMSKTVTDRLNKYNHIKSTPLYHPPKYKERYYCGEYGDYILSVGRFETLKRMELLIYSLKYCDKSIKAIFAGVGPRMEEVREIAEREGVSQRVRFAGFVSDEDLFKLYAGAFAVFFAPVDEDYGYITLESFLSKKPVLTARDSGGSLEFVIDGQNGYVCSVDHKEFGERIQELWQDKKKARLFGQYGYEIVKDISWDNVVDRLTETL